MPPSSGFKALSSFLPPRRDPPGFLRVNFFNPFFWLVNPKINDWVNIIRNLLSNKVVIFLLGILGQWIANKYYHWSSLRKWRQQIFLDRVQAVLFSASPRQVESGRVEKRTMFEVDLTNVLNGNEAAAEEVRIAASKCTKQKPFITQHLEPSERYHVLNAVLNCVSCQYSSGHLIADLGGNYISDWYAFAITAESVDTISGASLPNFVPSLLRRRNSKNKNNPIEDTRTKKLRIILVKESILQSISDNHSLYVEFHGVSGRHDHRWKMLHHMGEMLLRQALDGSNRHILRVMLSVPSVSGESQTHRSKTMSTPPAMLPAYLNTAEQGQHELLKDRLEGLVKQKRALIKQDPEKETPKDGDQILNADNMLPGRPRKNTTVAMPRRKLNVTSPLAGRDADSSPALYTPRRPSISRS
eukprot:g5923.t1